MSLRVLKLALLRAALHGPFMEAEVVGAAQRVRARKAVACLWPLALA